MKIPTYLVKGVHRLLSLKNGTIQFTKRDGLLLNIKVEDHDRATMLAPPTPTFNPESKINLASEVQNTA